MTNGYIPIFFLKVKHFFYKNTFFRRATRYLTKFSKNNIVILSKYRDYTFYQAGTLYCENNTINVLALNAGNKASFQPVLKKDLANLLHLRRQGSREIGRLKLAGHPVAENINRMQNIKNQIRFVKRTLLKLSDNIYIKRPEQPLLDIVGQKLQIRLTYENVVYLCGLSHIEKI